jgi:hypothetical protein
MNAIFPTPNTPLIMNSFLQRKKNRWKQSLFFAHQITVVLSRVTNHVSEISWHASMFDRLDTQQVQVSVGEHLGNVRLLLQVDRLNEANNKTK